MGDSNNLESPSSPSVSTSSQRDRDDFHAVVNFYLLRPSKRDDKDEVKLVFEDMKNHSAGHFKIIDEFLHPTVRCSSILTEISVHQQAYG